MYIFFSLSQRTFFLNAFSSLERSSLERFITMLKGKTRESKNRFSRDGTLSVSPTPPEKCYSFSVTDELQRQQRSVNFLSAGGGAAGVGGGQGGVTGVLHSRLTSVGLRCEVAPVVSLIVIPSRPSVTD